MGKSQRTKGRNGENEIVKLLQEAGLIYAKRISETGMPGPDVRLDPYDCEVKIGSHVGVTDYKWLEDAQLLFKRRNREQWLVTMELSTLIDLLS